MKTKIPDIIECPGAWYGTSPTEEYAHGHVIIDPSRVRDAFAWLSRRFWILETKLTTDQGLSIALQLKVKGMPLS